MIPQGAFLAKIDLKAAYRKVPVHPEDQYLLGISWKDQIFCDRVLPFGLRSAPIIFNAVADALAWAMLCVGIPDLVHYLDDFLFWAPDYLTCSLTLETAARLSARLGLPVEPSKVEGPATSLTFLGIEVDTVSRELRLPRLKLARLKDTVEHWATRRSMTKHQLEVLIGQLNDAAQVVPAGRPFLRNLLDAKSSLSKPHHFTRLNEGCRADLAWWSSFIVSWNGVGLFPASPLGPIITADASGAWGCGAYEDSTFHWFQVTWPSLWEPVNIAAKELFPFLVAIAVWGHRWQGSKLRFHSDNQAAVLVLNRGSAKDPTLAHLLRSLFFFLARFNITYEAFHVPGTRNQAADALSRNRHNDFCSIFPQAPKSPAHIPQSLLSLLLDTSLSWTSPRWKSLFSDCLNLA